MSNTTANSWALSSGAPEGYTPWKDGQTLDQILANARVLEESEPGAGRAYMRDVIRSREEQIAPSPLPDEEKLCAGPVNCEESPADGGAFPGLGNILCAPPEPELVAEERKRRKEEREKVGDQLTPALHCAALS